MTSIAGFTLHGFYRSSASYRVRIGLNLKQLDVELVSKHLRSKEHLAESFLALNPQGLVPVLEHGGRVFAQSLAILEYLDEVVPEPPLLPAEPASRADVRAMAQIVACEMHPLGNLRVLQYLQSDLGLDETQVQAWYAHWMAAGFSALEELVSRRGDGAHCFGSSITLADVCLVPQVYNARRFRCDLAPYPTVVAIADGLATHAAFAAAHPDRQPDAGS